MLFCFISGRHGIIHRNIHPDCIIVEKLYRSGGSSTVTPNNANISSTKPHNGIGEGLGTVSAISMSQSNLLEGSQSTDQSVFSGSQEDGENSANTSSSKKVRALRSHSSASPSKILLQKSKSTVSSDQPRFQLVYVLGDFWFLHNPRITNCQFSYGRADWGDSVTKPPESGEDISEKSDIWALGVCIYIWITKGCTIHYASQFKAINFDVLFSNIPLKWGIWIQSLLRMCLQKNHKYRSTSQEIYEFLIKIKREYK